MECGDSSPLSGEGFSLHDLAVDPNGTRVRLPEGPACQVRYFGGTCLSRPLFSEGPACRVR
ncbi:MAG: hypothetical protein KatS3mg112_1170 [Thermogutta sp.]|nr:MAG: hypothetical protein KatS3mg112_1170 [Thermogutta sp.]